jgi:hypothetical protein
LAAFSSGSDTRAACPGVTLAAVTAIPRPSLPDGLTLNEEEDEDEDALPPSLDAATTAAADDDDAEPKEEEEEEEEEEDGWPARSACLRRTPRVRYAMASSALIWSQVIASLSRSPRHSIAR